MTISLFYLKAYWSCSEQPH